jgi:choline dehydrogenase-like flavoprotein
MHEPHWDVVIVGTGAGGCAAAHTLAAAGLRIALLERGDHLPRDDSTLAVDPVFGEGRYKSRDRWHDARGRTLTLDEFHNVGGKTKWYGAALLRFAPHEFDPDPAHGCPGWPFGYDELAPWYARAEQLLGVRPFAHGAGLGRLLERITADGAWSAEALPLGLAPEILDHVAEARHFDGFASPLGLKHDAETALLTPLLGQANVTLRTRCTVTGLLHVADDPARITGVVTADGERFTARHVILAAGALHSPRLLQGHLRATGMDRALLSAPLVGANLKMHLNSALLAFGPAINRDQLRKTALFRHAAFPHTTVQCLGWLDGEILATQLPSALPRFVADLLGRRAWGFFVTTEDGSSRGNRVAATDDGVPLLDYDPARTPAALAEHRAAIAAFKTRLLRAGLVGAARPMWPHGTAHALGTLMAGGSSASSVVDGHGRVHGLHGLHVADGSALPRSSRVNPALTIYAWGLRLGAHLATADG